jgi:hypothetical protein
MFIRITALDSILRLDLIANWGGMFQENNFILHFKNVQKPQRHHMGKGSSFRLSPSEYSKSYG